jgi:hypothetical protein
MTRDEERDLLGQRLMEHCPVASLSAAGPWALKSERERELWRLLADLALAIQPLAPEFTHQLELMETLVAENTRLGTLRRYVRHAEGCTQAPCSCGLAALLNKTP